MWAGRTSRCKMPLACISCSADNRQRPTVSVSAKSKRTAAEAGPQAFARHVEANQAQAVFGPGHVQQGARPGPGQLPQGRGIVLQSHPRTWRNEPRRHKLDDHVAASLGIGGPQGLAAAAPRLSSSRLAIAFAKERAEMRTGRRRLAGSSMRVLSMACCIGPPRRGREFDQCRKSSFCTTCSRVQRGASPAVHRLPCGKSARQCCRLQRLFAARRGSY